MSPTEFKRDNLTGSNGNYVSYYFHLSFDLRDAGAWMIIDAWLNFLSSQRLLSTKMQGCYVAVWSEVEL